MADFRFISYIVLFKLVSMCVLDAGILERFRDRVDEIRRNIPRITKAADEAAERWVSGNAYLSSSRYGGSYSFGRELISRAGGLDNLNDILVNKRRGSGGPHHVTLVGSSSSKDMREQYQHLQNLWQEPWLVVAFAAKEDITEDMKVDHVIDNFGGANQNPSPADIALNSLVNVTQGWMWKCELTAALTRLGHHPGVIQAKVTQAGIEHNEKYRYGRKPKLWTTSKVIPAGKLAGEYLDAVVSAIAQAKDKTCQQELDHAARVCLDYLKRGKRVIHSSFTHYLKGELLRNKSLSPTKNVGIRWSKKIKGEKGLSRHGQKGDLIVMWGEWTLNLGWKNFAIDFQSQIREEGLDYIASFHKSEKKIADYPFNDDISDAKAFINQPWPFEGTVVNLPFPPYKMAPITGIWQGMLYFALDEKVYRGLKATSVNSPGEAVLSRN